MAKRLLRTCKISVLPPSNTQRAAMMSPGLSAVSVLGGRNCCACCGSALPSRSQVKLPGFPPTTHPLHTHFHIAGLEKKNEDDLISQVSFTRSATSNGK